MAVGVITAGVTILLLAIASQAAPGTDRANARLDAVRTGLAAGGGGAAAAGLILAFRRQYHQEVATLLTDRDATERRVTELYAKAAEELGSDKAPVRLAGLYALERLAQENAGQRQTVVNLICAYLRVPFDPPSLPGSPRKRGARLAAKTADRNRDFDSGHAEELLVRLAAQKIITDHLYRLELDTSWPRRSTPSVPTFWPGMELDLSGAVLIDFTLQGKIRVANFSGTRFIGGANFAHAEFDGHSYFNGARFEGGSGHFYGAWFGLRAVFIGTDFGEEEANFEAATFTGMTFFRDAKFRGGVSFTDARALVDFNTNWGRIRDWPTGWYESAPVADDEITPSGRWSKGSEQGIAINKWNMVRKVTS